MSLKIIFFIFAALAGLALNWFAFTLREEADNHSRNRNRESGFHGSYGSPKLFSSIYTRTHLLGRNAAGGIVTLLFFLWHSRSQSLLRLYGPTSDQRVPS
jgi:hypothetical protein